MADVPDYSNLTERARHQIKPMGTRKVISLQHYTLVKKVVVKDRPINRTQAQRQEKSELTRDGEGEK